MAENFDLIFGQNASQQYAWNDTDYQNGWETIGNIPPTATQFDALQRRADTKAQELNSRLITVEQSIAGGGSQKREPDTEYTVGTILTYDDLPMNWVIECIVGGISSANDIILPSPIVEGARILDGTVTWALRKIATYGGIGYRQSSTACPTGSIAFSTALPAGWYLEATTGGTTSASDLVITSPAIGDTVTDGTVVWTIRKVADTTDATTTTHGLMSASDKTKLNGIEANANKYTLPTASASVKGGIKVGSGLSMSGETLNNTYSYTLPTASSSVKGGIKIGSGLSMNGETLNNAYSLPTASSSTLGGVKTGSNITNNSGTISLTKANVTSALGYTPPTTDTTYSTGTASYSGTTKLYTGTGTNTDGTMTQKAINTALSGKSSTDLSNLTAAGEAKIANISLTSDFTIIYPNGGTEANPASVTAASTYIEANPFPNYIVHCQVELLYGNEWGVAQFDGYYSSGWGGHGVFVTQHNNGNIILKTGSSAVLGTSQYQYTVCPSSWSNIGANQSTLPCRVKVWKIGKIPTT